MAPEESSIVSVSRRIAAPVKAVFAALADPTRHPVLDGSGMVREAITTAPIRAAGDVFTIRMYLARLGYYEMDNHVVTFVQDERIGWEPAAAAGHGGDGVTRWGHQWSYRLEPDGPDATVVTESYDCSPVPLAERESMENGKVWLEGMAATLERLDALCTGNPVEA